MEEAYELLIKKKLTTDKEIANFCLKESFEKVAELCAEIFAMTSVPQKNETKGSLFNFSASFALSGTSYPCDSISCRTKRVRDLARFSAVYSDSTTIYNPFDFVYFFLNPKGDYEMSEDKFRFESLNALFIINEFKPLIERGLLRLSRTIYPVCSNCKTEQKKITESIYEELGSIAKKIIFPMLQRSVNIEYEQDSFHLMGLDKLIGEDIYMHYKKFPSYLLEKGKKIEDLKSMSFNNPLIGKIIGEAIESLMAQKISNIEKLTQTYLTNSILEKTLIEKMDKKVDARTFDFFIEGLPLIKTLSYEKILKIRDRYSDEFDSFQNHVSELVQKGKDFETQEEFDLFVKNKLDKQLINLKKISAEGNKELALKGFSTGTLLGASIIISSLNNLDFSSIASLMTAGLGCTDLALSVKKIQTQVEQSPLYFYYELVNSK